MVLKKAHNPYVHNFDLPSTVVTPSWTNLAAAAGLKTERIDKPLKCDLKGTDYKQRV